MDLDEDGEVLAGGGRTVVTRIGETVRRPAQPWTPSVHRLLRHLAAEGFTGAPRVHGIDAEGREILDYIAGAVGHYPWSEAVRSEAALRSAGRLLREYHDATAPIADASDDRWMFPALEPIEVICHGDVAPYNCIFDGERAVALIDFDTAHPGPRAWDLAYAVYRFAPFTDPGNSDGSGDLEQQTARARAFLDAYGASRKLRIDTVALLGPRLQALVDLMRRAAAEGDEQFQRHIDEGHLATYLSDIAFMENNLDRILRAQLHP